MYQAIFFISLVLVGLFVWLKVFEWEKKEKTWFTLWLGQGDKPILRFVKHLKKELAYINWRNTVLLSKFIYHELRTFSFSFKRRFDSKQSKFFVMMHGKTDLQVGQSRSSEFLKSVNDHKNKIRSL